MQSRKVVRAAALLTGLIASVGVVGCQDPSGEAVVDDGSIRGELAVYIADDFETGSQTKKYALRSASGDIRVGIKEGSRLFVDARSRSGDVASELPVSDTPPEGDAPLVELRANTMSGDITIHRAGR